MEYKHGTNSTYSNYGCRCDPCREAHNALAREYVRKRREQLAADGSGVPHGTSNGYTMGCRCELCKDASANRARQKGKAIKKYGVTREAIERERDKRGGVCDICQKRPRTPLVADHDHIANRFRGFICNGCNTGIGKLGDTAEGVRRALVYLEHYEGGK